MAPKGSCADCGLEPKTRKKKDMWLETTWAQAETEWLGKRTQLCRLSMLVGVTAQVNALILYY